MGGTHAVYILTQINEAGVRRVFAAWKKGHQLYLLNATSQLYQGAALDRYALAVYLHVDDFGAIGIARTTPTSPVRP